MTRSLGELVDELSIINIKMWKIEDEMANLLSKLDYCNREPLTGTTREEVLEAIAANNKAKFDTNQKRVTLKNEINELMGSRTVEWKKYGHG